MAFRREMARTSTRPATLLELLRGRDTRTVRLLLARSDLPPEVSSALAARCGVPEDPTLGRPDGPWLSGLPGMHASTHGAPILVGVLAASPGLSPAARQTLGRRLVAGLRDARAFGTRIPSGAASQRPGSGAGSPRQGRRAAPPVAHAPGPQYVTHSTVGAVRGVQALGEIIAWGRTCLADPPPGPAIPVAPSTAAALWAEWQVVAQGVEEAWPHLDAEARSWLTDWVCRPAHLACAPPTGVEAVMRWCQTAEDLQTVARQWPASLARWTRPVWAALLTHPEREVRLSALALSGRTRPGPAAGPPMSSPVRPGPARG